MCIRDRCGSDLAITVTFGLFVVLATQELFYLMRRKGYTPFSVLGTVVVGCLVVAYWVDRHYVREGLWVYVVAFLFILGLFICQGFLCPRQAGVTSIALTLFGVFYIWLLASFTQRMYYLEDIGLKGVLVFLTTVKCGDIGAYCTGRLFGKHHPFKRISPGKTTEGYVGGLVWSVVVSVLFGRLLLEEPGWPHWVGFGMLVWFFGALGDLFESIIKRDLDAKDSGKCLPGLGGVLDLLDSVLLAGPAAYFMLRCLSAGT